MLKKRSNCPLSCWLEIFGDKWTLLIIRDIAFRGKKQYKEFISSREGISTNILADRLRLLVSNGVLIKTRSSSNKLVIHYELTEKGKSLAPILLSIAKWGNDHIPDTMIIGA